MIFVAAGTQDGRELAGAILEAGYEVTASVVSRYGKSLLEAYPKMRINDEPLDRDALEAYLEEHAIKCFVDASHPYAENVSQNAMEACRALCVPYIRYERAETPIVYERLHRVTSYEEAAEAAASLGEHIFLTTGSRRLHIFKSSEALRDKCLTIRVLPDSRVLKECEELGFTPKEIIAMQGPFSEELNIELYRKYNADVVVTKNSGAVGGTDTKISAAMALQVPIVLIDRPHIAYDRLAEDFEGVLTFLKEVTNGLY
ncbi:precorrin-6A reductase [Selenomonas sp. TAMA-11512]|uniref:precorrin-6A reductase n=1 Tax=Selenomonas sp. TAMA-11512 TaxID=3095337 RepID=UPI00308B00BA|nr:precorrin-6A reductase [Selenomonas sp. TAMA-11512]